METDRQINRKEEKKKRGESRFAYANWHTNDKLYILYHNAVLHKWREKKREREIGETESITVYFERRLQGFRNLAKLFLIVRFLGRLSFRSRVTTTKQRE